MNKFKSIIAMSLMLAFFTISAHAVLVFAPYGYFSSYGYDYENYTGLYNDSPDNQKMYSYAGVKVDNASDVDIGYMGASARIYTSNGKLAKSTPYVYNEKIEKECVSTLCVLNAPFDSKYYYAKGETKAYNGNGYDAYNTFATPNLATDATRASEPLPLDISNAIAPSYPANELGYTYGSSLYASSPDQEPDLILASGTNGEEGYVYASDLEGDQPTNPEEAIVYQEKMDELFAQYKSGEVVIFRTIPLYESDGVTVIGEFEISGIPHPDPDGTKNINLEEWLANLNE